MAGVPHGWRRVDGGSGKLFSVYRSSGGWTAAHCGHPTAIWPYQLFDPAGQEHRTPAGKAWPNLATLAEYVISVEQRELAERTMRELAGQLEKDAPRFELPRPDTFELTAPPGPRPKQRRMF